MKNAKALQTLYNHYYNFETVGTTPRINVILAAQWLGCRSLAFHCHLPCMHPIDGRRWLYSAQRTNKTGPELPLSKFPGLHLSLTSAAIYEKEGTMHFYQVHVLSAIRWTDGVRDRGKARATDTSRSRTREQKAEKSARGRQGGIYERALVCFACLPCNLRHPTALTYTVHTQQARCVFHESVSHSSVRLLTQLSSLPLAFTTFQYICCMREHYVKKAGTLRRKQLMARDWFRRQCHNENGM